MSISETMRNIEYLFRKYEPKIESYKFVPPRKTQELRVMTIEQHDHIYKTAQTLKATEDKLQELLGWSRCTIRRVRTRNHPLYDPVRSEAWRKEAV